jgi:hypothetical protein
MAFPPGAIFTPVAVDVSSPTGGSGVFEAPHQYAVGGAQTPTANRRSRAIQETSTIGTGRYQTSGETAGQVRTSGQNSNGVASAFAGKGMCLR